MYNTWPDIDGGFIPSAARLFFEAPWWRNLYDNTLTVQFEHRMVAYTLLALALLHAADAVRAKAADAVINGALWLAAAMIMQAVLGILTLASSGSDSAGADAPGHGDCSADACGPAGGTPDDPPGHNPDMENWVFRSHRTGRLERF